MCESELWKPVTDFEGYEVSSCGQVRSLDRNITSQAGWSRFHRGRTLVPRPTKTGYLRVTLSDDAGRYVHRLVAREFIGPPPEGYDVCHYDNDKSNNCVRNLRYDTRYGNMQDQKRHGTHAKRQQKECLRGHPLTYPNLRPDNTGGGYRRCRSCNFALSGFKNGRITESEIQSESDWAFEQYTLNPNIVMLYRPGTFSGRVSVKRTECPRGHEYLDWNLDSGGRCRSCRWAQRQFKAGNVSDLDQASHWAYRQFEDNPSARRLTAKPSL